MESRFKNQPATTRLLRSLRTPFASVSMAIVLVGCMAAISVRPPTAAELGKVKIGQATLILFQTRLKLGEKAVPPLNTYDPNGSYRVYLANLGEGTAPAEVPAVSPSPSAAADGWRYLVLAPGTYHLLILPPGTQQNPPTVALHPSIGKFVRVAPDESPTKVGLFWAPDIQGFVLRGTPQTPARELSGFWFQVPEKQSVIYLGSIGVSCSTRSGAFGDLVGECSDYEIDSDPEKARAVAESTMPGIGGLDTQLLVPYGVPRDGSKPLGPGQINVVVGLPPQFGVSYTGARMGPWGVIFGVGQAVGVFNVLAIAAELSSRAAADRSAQARATEALPCIEKLSQSLSDVQYASVFASAVAASMRSHASTVEFTAERESAAARRMVIDVPMMHLRESSDPESLALEMGVRVRLHPLDSPLLAYDSLLVFGEDFPAQNPLVPCSRLYQRLIPEHARPHPIAQWCGPNGEALLKEEIGMALQHIARQVALDLE